MQADVLWAWLADLRAVQQNCHRVDRWTPDQPEPAISRARATASTTATTATQTPALPKNPNPSSIALFRTVLAPESTEIPTADTIGNATGIRPCPQRVSSRKRKRDHGQGRVWLSSPTYPGMSANINEGRPAGKRRRHASIPGAGLGTPAATTGPSMTGRGSGDDNTDDNMDALHEGGDDPFSTPRAPASNALRALQGFTGSPRASPGWLSHPPSAPSQSSESMSSASVTTTTTSRTRSSSPTKRTLDLTKLEKPVYWTGLSQYELRKSLESHSPGACALYDSIRRVLRRGYLPLELKDVLVPEFSLEPDDDLLFSLRPPQPRPQGTTQYLQTLSPSQQPGPPDISDRSFQLHSLFSELTTLREIVKDTKRFKRVSRSEASWNSYVHGKMLDLAVKEMGGVVGAEDVTRANIAKTFNPLLRQSIESRPDLGSLSNSLETSSPANNTSGAKMIDYVFTLDTDPDSQTTDHSSFEQTLSAKVIEFVGNLKDLPSFNQTTYPPLCNSPAGVFMETKVDGKRYAEGQSQLGVWVASWIRRVQNFRPGQVSLPVIPLVLVVREVWELWFAIDKGDYIDIYGNCMIGNTDSLDDAYKLLASLQTLSSWMASDFRRWVEQVVNLTS